MPQRPIQIRLYQLVVSGEVVAECHARSTRRAVARFADAGWSHLSILRAKIKASDLAYAVPVEELQ